MTSLFTNFIQTLHHLIHYVTTPTTTEFANLALTSEVEARINCQLRRVRQANRRKLYSDRLDCEKDSIDAIQL